MASPRFLNALRAFEASARHQSFSGAAAELNVTPAAVGQLVRSLEDWVGAPLFHRTTGGRKRLTPTAAAERALPDIRAGFDRLSVGLSRLQAGPRSSVLMVTMSPAFAAKWLLPRIENFQARCPNVDLRMDTSLALQDFAERGIDVGVRYGKGVWPGLVAEKLMDEEVAPVCSPEWLARNGPIASPRELAGKALIHDVSVDARLGFPSWSNWLLRAGAASVNAARGMQVNNSAAVLQAAIEGQGVALAGDVMARDDVAAGRLVRLFPGLTFASEMGYYLVYRAECASIRKVQAFREWLTGEASRFSRDPSGRHPAPARRRRASRAGASPAP